jgi:hypothetical protein
MDGAVDSIMPVNDADGKRLMQRLDPILIQVTEPPASATSQARNAHRQVLRTVTSLDNPMKFTFRTD